MILSVFDFDVTLFRPDGSWNTPVVERARRAYGRGYSVLMTGRPEFQRLEVTQTVMDKGIPFHRVITVGPTFTGLKKRAEIERIIRAVQPSAVEIWDDKPDLLASYGRLVDSLGLDKRLHFVGAH